MISAVLFDLDGTLADTAPDMAHTVNRMREKRGLAIVPLEKIRPHVSQGARGMICSAFDITTEHPEFSAMREEFLDLYGNNLCRDTVLFPGMLELLGMLETRNIPWGVVTNKFERFANSIMKHLDLENRVSVVVGGDTCPRSKPFPDPLLHAAAAIGIAPTNTLYVGDDVRDIQAARAAGMPVLAAGYGYLGIGAPPANWNADAVVQNVGEIGKWIDAAS